MIAKIGRSGNLYGALAYNQTKVEKGTAEVIFASKIIESSSGEYSTGQILQSFDPYLLANRNTEKHTLHISLNPDPKDKLTDLQFGDIAAHYMQQMGYREQPYIVFKHRDTGREHIHIVSVCIDENGRKISDRFEKRRSMAACRHIEAKFNLSAAGELNQVRFDPACKPVDYQKGDFKSQLSAVIRHLPKSYFFQSMGEYNALLSLFNIASEKVVGRGGEGLVYYALDEKGNRVGKGFKSSLFGKAAGLSALEMRMQKSGLPLKDNSVKLKLKGKIANAVEMGSSEKGLRKILSRQGIDFVLRQNDSGRIYGVTFIDHQGKLVINGSRLGKEFSANAFEKAFAEGNNLDRKSEIPTIDQEAGDVLIESVKPFSADLTTIDFMESSGELSQSNPAEDFEEREFANRMKRKKKTRKRNGL